MTKEVKEDIKEYTATEDCDVTLTKGSAYYKNGYLVNGIKHTLREGEKLNTMTNFSITVEKSKHRV